MSKENVTKLTSAVAAVLRSKVVGFFLGLLTFLDIGIFLIYFYEDGSTFFEIYCMNTYKE